MVSEDFTIRFLEQLSSTGQLIMDRRLIKISQGDSFVLNYLYTHNCKAYPKEISEAMAVSTARVAKILGKLNSQGLILRKCDDKDNRKVIIVLTSKGVEKVAEFRKNAIKKLEVVLSALDEEEIEEFMRIRKKLNSALLENIDKFNK